MAELRTVGVAEMRSRLALGPAAAEADGVKGAGDTARRKLRRSVALLGSFDPSALVTSEAPEGRRDVAAFLAADCERVGTPAGPAWRLKSAVRSATLAEVGPRGLRSLVLASEPMTADDPLRGAMALLAGRQRPRVEDLSEATLRASLVAMDWLEPLGMKLPDRSDILDRLAVLEIQRPLRMLVDDNFVGRTKELAQLEHHFFGTDTSIPLAIDGTGGIGKSTLVARAVLTATDSDRKLLPVYVTFDRPDLRADRPFTLMAEAARQLAVLGPRDQRGAAHELEADARASERRSWLTRSSRANVAKSNVRTRDTEGADLQRLVKRYASLLDGSLRRGRLLWVLDTFEVAQRVGPTALGELYRLLDVLATELGPRLRVLIAGRAPVTGIATTPLHLEGLDPTAARRLLRREVAGTHYPPGVLDQVLRQVGPNPLSLRLVGELLRREAAEGHSGRAPRSVLFKVGPDQIQGVLYRRILDRLESDDLRRIANPGLTVRRIDAGVLREVLARPCGLGELTDAQAADLLERLGREASLVDVIGPGVLVHRSDVRKLMLPLLEKAEPRKVERIRRAGVRFHATRFAADHDPVDKTEELYLRLALGQPAATLEKAWDDQAASMLQGAVDELPPASHAFLADRLGWIIDPALLRAADDAAWATQAAKQARDRLDAGDPAGALRIASERTGPEVRAFVDPVVVESLAVLGRHDAAIRAARATIDWATSVGAWETYIGVALLAARVAEDKKRWRIAVQLLTQAREAAADTGDTISRVAAGAGLVRVRRRSGAKVTSEIQELRDAVLAEGRALTRAQRRANPYLVRDLAAEFQSEAPDLVQDATDLVGVDLASEAGQELVKSLGVDERKDINDYLKTVGVEGAADADDEQLDWLASNTSAVQSARLSDYLRSDRETHKWENAVADAFRHETEAAAF